MTGAGRFILFSGLGALLALAGCGRSMLLQGERAAWRHQAEAQCIQSGAVKLGAGVVQIEPIEGPGMCGADFPLKVAALGESYSRLGYSDIPRPSGSIANSSPMPDWPPSQVHYARPMQEPPPQSMPVNGQQLRWVPGAPAIGTPQTIAPQTYAPQNAAPAGQPLSLTPQGVAPPSDDIPDDAILPVRRGVPQPMRPAYDARVYNPPPQQPRSSPPSLGPVRGPKTTGAILPATLKPAATLSCPIVSALERWVSEGVQPAALHWFGVQVTEIKQISAYSCRSMNGAGGHGISEHAFGNALDVAGFVLADGRKIMVKDGWHGSPKEQGFLHDVQLFACQTFVTVLAPGYNAAHYNHFHVDLQRRQNGRRPCRPAAIKGEVVAARARAVYASKHGGEINTGSIAMQDVRDAVPGADGLADDEEDDSATGSISTQASAKAGPTAEAVPGADGEPDEGNVTGSIAPRPGMVRKNISAREASQTPF